MVHHPYESFASSVENFIAQAADDPKVQSIKMTLYRAGGDSPIARSLMRAAERGVQVAVLVELKARFDEATNVGWAKALRALGCARRVRPGGVEDPRQVHPRGARTTTTACAATATSAPATTTPRPHALTKTSASSPATRDVGR